MAYYKINDETTLDIWTESVPPPYFIHLRVQLQNTTLTRHECKSLIGALEEVLREYDIAEKKELSR